MRVKHLTTKSGAQYTVYEDGLVRRFPEGEPEGAPQVYGLGYQPNTGVLHHPNWPNLKVNEPFLWIPDEATIIDTVRTTPIVGIVDAIDKERT